MTRFSRWDRRFDRQAIDLVHMTGRNLETLRAVNRRGRSSRRMTFWQWLRAFRPRLSR